MASASKSEIEPLAAIERARPFLDADFTGKGWKASELMRLAYFTVATSKLGRDAYDRADAAVAELLDEARNRYAAGFYANPFAEPVTVRPT